MPIRAKSRHVATRGAAPRDVEMSSGFGTVARRRIVGGSVARRCHRLPIWDTGLCKRMCKSVARVGKAWHALQCVAEFGEVEVAVSVHRERDRAVPRQLLRRLRVDATARERRQELVTKGVE